MYRVYLEKLYDLYNMYCDQGIHVFLGDFNASCLLDKVQKRDVLLRQFLYDCNLCPLNTLPCCTGASNSFVSYDERFMSLLDYICLPVEYTHTLQHVEICDDHCFERF